MRGDINDDFQYADYLEWPIIFGLVNIPVALHPATSESGLDFDWLDKRTMDPVGYKRINKKTGQEIENENIVKGISYTEDRYVVLTDDEIKHALPKSTQTIEIEAFDSFAAEIMTLVEEKAKAGKITSVLHTEVEPASAPTADIIDFTELLRRSLSHENARRTFKPSVKTKNISQHAGSERELQKPSIFKQAKE